ncbi:retropepsin-like aspartic protease [Xanthomarina sp. F1114]|uniref:retropepsin-like aspartic protease n=1 Tax=Xanthomarina sp. F1114 TaxID=2996019 RepID=UPI00225DFDE4|nr:retropepsin-like aspartic protease [Xanthomarina sp. F1114]MCX7548329.1 retropepsin-like aspartic protease [Xanthomarina sp. F1114]
MNRLITIFLFLITGLSFSQNKLNKQISIPFTLTNNGHIIILCEVNGVQGNFVFDTGAGMNLLTKKFADKVVDLEKTSHFTTGHRATGEEIQSDLWNSKTLKIADFTIHKQVFAVYDFEFPLDGLISLVPFKDKQITIDFENKMLNIESDKSLDDLIKNKDFEMPILIKNNKDITIDIATYIMIDDKLTLLVNLDSGAGFGVYRFNSRYMTNLKIDPTQLKSEYKNSYFKPKEGNTFYYTLLSKISDENNNAKILDSKVTFIDGLIYEGIMGIDWIGKKITIDIPNKRLIVKK